MDCRYYNQTVRLECRVVSQLTVYQFSRAGRIFWCYEEQERCFILYCQTSAITVGLSMLNLVEKQSLFTGRYFVVYLGDWLVLQTKSSVVASRCVMNGPTRSWLEKLRPPKETETQKAA